MKVANAIVRRILIETRSSVDIITWDCVKKMKYLGMEIVPLVHPILGVKGQEVKPMGMIHLPLRFGDKAKVRTLEVDFLVVDVPIAYSIILGRPTLHKIKAIIAPYLLQLQFEADDGSVGTKPGDQQTTQECYLISIHPSLLCGRHPVPKSLRAPERTRHSPRVPTYSPGPRPWSTSLLWPPP
ncbi:hypothetical protein Cgig2_024223 [Carnegiea gigantea]|uniref:Uncharacterized protein n=1 Tax=Carnegiea gigantea TaxID=171969 RepID=A0A9Q1GQ34_9CARY|nr:hypothetical protein Cgig2_024223 [Carnegiea gigantea]